MTEHMVISLPKIPYIYTVYDRMFGDFPAKNTIYTPYMTECMVISLPKIPYIYTVHDRMFGDFPAKNTIYLHCI